MSKTYTQLTREIQALQAHADKLHQSEKKDVIARLNESIAQYGLSAQDLHFPGSSATSSSASASSSSARAPRSGASIRAATSSDSAKYSDGPGRVWGGRGPRPAWLREAIAQGRILESFTATSSAPRGTASAPIPGKVSLPPLYRHPKTGQTWSGRGPKPAWLKQGLKKRGATIDDFLISAQAPGSTSASTDVPQAPAPAQATPVSPKGNGKNAGTAKAGGNGQIVRKSPAEKAAERTGPALATAKKTATAAPAKKAAAAKSTLASTFPTSPKAEKTQKAQKATSKVDITPSNAPEAPGASSAPTPASTAASVEKSIVKPGAKSTTSVKDSKNAKPPVKKAAPARKNLPGSMAPSSKPAPMPPAAPTAPPSGSESNENESQTNGSDS